MIAGLRARVGAHFRAHHEWYWVPALYALAILYVYRAIFFPGDGPQLGLGWDTIEAYWADLSFLGHQIGGPDWPLWNPYEKAGYPYLAIPERGAYYPINWVLAWWGSIHGEVTWWLMQLKDWLHHLAAACMLHLFLRSRGLPRTAALVGGTAWLCSAPWLIHKASAVIWPMAWIPLLWLATDKLVEKPSWRRGCGLAAALVLAGHTGSAPGFFYALLCAVPYGALRVGGALWDARRHRRLKPYLIALAIGFAVALAVTLAMMIVAVAPTGQLTALAQRAKRDLGYVLMFPLPVKETLIGLLAPSNGKPDAYIGVVVLVLGACAVAVRPLRDRGAPILMLVGAAFFMLLSFGKATPLLSWLAEHVPGFDLFRVSNRYKLPAMPMLAALAGYGAAALIEAARGWSRQRIAGLIAIALVAGLTIWLVADLPPRKGRWPDDAHSVYLALAAAALATAALFTPKRFAWIAVALMVPIVAWEPQHWIHHTNKALEKKVDGARQDLAWLEGLADVRTDWRIYDEFVLEQRAGSRLAIREFRGYPAGASLEFRRYQRVITYARKHPELLGAFNIRYVFQGPHHRAGNRASHFKQPLDKMRPKHFRRLDTPRCQRDRRRRCPVIEVIHAMPAVYWVGAVEMTPDDKGGMLLDIVRRQIDELGEVRVAAVEQRALPAIGAQRAEALRNAAADPPAMVPGQVVRLEANRIVTRIKAPAAGVVVVNETMYPGWKVWVDGAPAEPFAVNWLVRGVAVDPGEHTVEWRFEPPHHQLYRWLWSLGLFALLAAALWPRRRRQPLDPAAGEVVKSEP